MKVKLLQFEIFCKPYLLLQISGELGINNETDIFTVREFDMGPYKKYFLNTSKNGRYYQMRDAFLRDLMPGYWVKTIDQDNGMNISSSLKHTVHTA